ncbi:MAG TPA: hypothetical protein VFN25_16700, partial [Dokdonella sp.]|uniref:hypothetical protein n=1 Tax=Dokdonella sp. TaxID=2291710 RepID=UPI002D806571
TLLGLIMALLTRSPGVLGLALLMIVVGLFGAVFSMAAARISANSRPDAAMLPPEALQAIRDKALAKAKDQSAQAKAKASQADPFSNQVS